MNRDKLLALAEKRGMGERVDEHCPFDETQLRVDLESPGLHICPCCHSTFLPRAAEAISEHILAIKDQPK